MPRKVKVKIMQNHHQASAAVRSRSVDTKKEGGYPSSNNRNGNVEAYKGCDTKGQSEAMKL